MCAAMSTKQNCKSFRIAVNQMQVKGSLENADLENADLKNTDLENADLENADLENTDLENADLENVVCLQEASFFHKMNGRKTI